MHELLAAQPGHLADVLTFIALTVGFVSLLALCHAAVDPDRDRTFDPVDDGPEATGDVTGEMSVPQRAQPIPPRGRFDAVWAPRL